MLPTALPADDAAGAPSAPADAVRLADYLPPEWLIDEVRLVVKLDPKATRVVAALSVRRNPAAAAAQGVEPAQGRSTPPPDFTLDGRNLTLIRAEIDGARIDLAALRRVEGGLVVPAALLPGDRFDWLCETEVNPGANTALEGLYISRGMYCTQCEAQGFRKITYFPDRPDVMSVYRCRIEAEKSTAPVLLSNGEPTESGDLGDGRHFVTWSDPHPKPCYLFALVAGDLSATTEIFETASGRRVDLQLFTRPGDEDKAAYALDALKRSMRWDETAYGREYDLDLFMIVAVDDFNMGAMENKGLNIFNSRYVLASPETATDRDYELIESVVAHEYFHNWTGNRITCRDWFQLCLKEGLTVFRDQQFSEDERSAAVARIDSVKALRSRQFREDQGPLAHPVRPDSYVEINNFYTATVYEKGAEIVRMLRTWLGADVYRRALDLYFERHDGQACTIEDFAACFETASGADLTQFKRWWSQAGTPRVEVTEVWHAQEGVFELTLAQSSPPTPGQPKKAPLVLPVRVGLLQRDGAEAPLPVTGAGAPGAGFAATLDAPRKTWRFEGLTPGAENRPVLSLNRNFSAPALFLRRGDGASDAALAADRAVLLAHDPDPFARWEAGRELALDTLLSVADSAAVKSGAPEAAQETAAAAAAGLASALGRVLDDEELDPAFKALMFALPGEDELAGETAARGLGPADPDVIHRARSLARHALGEALTPALQCAYAAMATPGPYNPTAEDAGRRALKNAALALLTHAQATGAARLAAAQFDGSDNMSDQLPALAALVHNGAPEADAALAQFYQRWRDDPLVVGKWFGVQATSPQPDVLDRVSALTAHPAFEWRNPNKFRALIGAFAAGATTAFHRADGAGYRFVIDWLLKLDPVNPQTTAKMLTLFETWPRYEPTRRALMKAELARVAAVPTLSKDAGEMVTRMLAAGNE